MFVKFDPERHHRGSIRLKGYDYRGAGAYFVTIVTQDRECLLGEIVEDAMRLNDAGRMVEKWWLELNHKFQRVETDEHVVMPNHFHGIILTELAVEWVVDGVAVRMPQIGRLRCHVR